MKRILGLAFSLVVLGLTSCKKEGCTDATATNYNANAKKDDGSCTYNTPVEPVKYSIPTTYNFVNSAGVSTVDYSGQMDRLKQLRELITYAKTGRTEEISAQVLKDMWANVGGNGNGKFSFTSSRQLKDKCFAADVASIETLFDEIAEASKSRASVASSGKAGVATSSTSSYLLDENGRDMAEMIEKSIMRSVFFHQALNVYLESEKMNADNTTLVAGKTYTNLEHFWDEAFGYFGVPTDFPTNVTSTDLYYWGKYCNGQNASLNTGINKKMMDAFLKGRAAISNKVLADRDEMIKLIRVEWEKIAAVQAMKYLDDAVLNFSDDAKRLHSLGEGYGFVTTLRYAPLASRKMTNAQIDEILGMFGTNFWNLTVADFNAIKAKIKANY